jgi:hypothetical protein
MIRLREARAVRSNAFLSQQKQINDSMFTRQKSLIFE